jgi:hypothetical protein
LDAEYLVWKWQITPDTHASAAQDHHVFTAVFDTETLFIRGCMKTLFRAGWTLFFFLFFINDCMEFEYSARAKFESGKKGDRKDATSEMQT